MQEFIIQCIHTTKKLDKKSRIMKFERPANFPDTPRKGDCVEVSDGELDGVTRVTFRNNKSTIITIDGVDDVGSDGTVESDIEYMIETGWILASDNGRG